MTSTQVYAPSQVPVLTVCGWLGAGKTTLLEHLIKTAAGMRIGILVNDMAAVNVDANTLARVVHAKEEMVEFSNGTRTFLFLPTCIPLCTRASTHFCRLSRCSLKRIFLLLLVHLNLPPLLPFVVAHARDRLYLLHSAS